MKTRTITLSIGGKTFKVVLPGEKEVKELTPAPQVENKKPAIFTLAEAIKIYIHEKEKAGELKVSTIDSYWNYHDNYFTIIKTLPIEALIVEDIQASINEEATHGRRKKTIQNAYSFLKSVLKVYRPDMEFKKGELVYPDDIMGVIVEA